MHKEKPRLRCCFVNSNFFCTCVFNDQVLIHE
uniref:Uncharacterized protein n=1 Tax=Arundo donax TaxID=35708 RepID=A0A0A9AHS5_ARUDO